MSKVRLYGDTSGFVDLKAPDVANDVTITLPNTTGPFATETYVDSAIAAIPGIGSNVVTAANLVSFTTSSATFADVTDVTVTITPTSATSKVFVVVTGMLGHDDGNLTQVRLNRDGTDIAVGSGGTGSQSQMSYQSGSVDYGQSFSISWLDSPATTSAVVYKLQAASSSGTGYVGRTGAITYRVPTVITAIEVAA